nr:hypothetical protein [uncultured Desulfobacter sp.]
MGLSGKKYVMLGFIIVLLTGCTSTRYRYIPPATEAGLNCVTQCQQHQNVCMNNEQINASAAYRQCQEISAMDYDRCLQDARMDFYRCDKIAERDYKHCLKHDKAVDQCRKKKCHKLRCYKNRCYKTDNYSRCKSNFRECYQQCGGFVEIIETE